MTSCLYLVSEQNERKLTWSVSVDHGNFVSGLQQNLTLAVRFCTDDQISVDERPVLAGVFEVGTPCRTGGWRSGGC